MSADDEVILSEIDAAIDAQSRPASELFAMLWAWLLLALSKPFGLDAPRRAEFARVAYRRDGYRVSVIDLETNRRWLIVAESSPEARQVCAALSFAATRRPKASAEELTRATIEVVTAARERSGRK